MILFTPDSEEIQACKMGSMVGNEQQTPQTVDALLHALGLGKYVIPFKAEEIALFVSSNDAVKPGWLLKFLRGISPAVIKEMQQNIAKVWDFKSHLNALAESGTKGVQGAASVFNQASKEQLQSKNCNQFFCSES
ncbi:hypothetical protein K1719_032876 [Acacia pycnantha]|nr:hypothetical protein K1719_032876 [Acacia pycnantha]